MLVRYTGNIKGGHFGSLHLAIQSIVIYFWNAIEFYSFRLSACFNANLYPRHYLTQTFEKKCDFLTNRLHFCITFCVTACSHSRWWRAGRGRPHEPPSECREKNLVPFSAFPRCQATCRRRPRGHARQNKPSSKHSVSTTRTKMTQNRSQDTDVCRNDRVLWTDVTGLKWRLQQKKSHIQILSVTHHMHQDIPDRSQNGQLYVKTVFQ